MRKNLLDSSWIFGCGILVSLLPFTISPKAAIAATNPAH